RRPGSLSGRSTVIASDHSSPLSGPRPLAGPRRPTPDRRPTHMRMYGLTLTALVAALSLSAAAQQPSPAVVSPGQPAAAAPAPQTTTPPPAALPNCPDLAAALRTVGQNDVRNRDWANLTRYREANHSIVPPAAGQGRVVFMGDSITDVWQQPRFGGFFPGKPYIDRGISAQTTPQMLLRF